jgi:hypothetical protein
MEGFAISGWCNGFGPGSYGSGKGDGGGEKEDD